MAGLSCRRADLLRQSSHSPSAAVGCGLLPTSSGVAQDELSENNLDQMDRTVIGERDQALVSGQRLAVQFRKDDAPTDAPRVFDPDLIAGGAVSEHESEARPRPGNAWIKMQCRAQ